MANSNSKKNYPQPTNIPIILGSSSSSRRTVLESYGWNFGIMSPNIDEKSIRDDNSFELPLKIALAKTNELYSKCSPDSELILITADQIVLFNDKELQS